jgi:AcrR family transcriptional regulator
MTVKRSKERTQRQICEAALACYAEYGATRATLAEIAKRAKVPPPLIHYHFPTPTSLFQGVLDLILADLRSAVTAPLTQKTSSPAALLEDYITSYFGWIRRKPDLFAVWLHFYYVAAVDPRFRELNTRIRLTGRERIASILYRGLETKKFRLPRGVDVPAAALEIQSYITGGCIMAVTEDACTLDEAMRMVVAQSLRLTR